MLNNYLEKRNIVQKMQRVQQKLARKYGEFVLFALLERENWPDRWDVIVSSTWLNESIRVDIDAVLDVSAEFLNQNEMLTISQVIVLKPKEPFVQQVLSFMQVQHPTNTDLFEFSNQEFNGIEFRHGYVLQWNMSPLNAPLSVTA